MKAHEEMKRMEKTMAGDEGAQRRWLELYGRVEGINFDGEKVLNIARRIDREDYQVLREVISFTGREEIRHPRMVNFIRGFFLRFGRPDIETSGVLRQWGNLSIDYLLLSGCLEISYREERARQGRGLRRPPIFMKRSYSRVTSEGHAVVALRDAIRAQA